MADMAERNDSMNLYTIIQDGIMRRRIRTALSILGITVAATALFKSANHRMLPVLRQMCMAHMTI